MDLESAQPNDAYWKSLGKQENFTSNIFFAAEEREKALNETLEENKSLCEIMEVRQQELEELAVNLHQTASIL